MPFVGNVVFLGGVAVVRTVYHVAVGMQDVFCVFWVILKEMVQKNKGNSSIFERESGAGAGMSFVRALHGEQIRY